MVTFACPLKIVLANIKMPYQQSICVKRCSSYCIKHFQNHDICIINSNTIANVRHDLIHTECNEKRKHDEKLEIGNNTHAENRNSFSDGRKQHYARYNHY